MPVLPLFFSPNMQTTALLIILGVSLVLVGPILFIVIRSLRAGAAMARRTAEILATGSPERAWLLTLGPSPVSTAYPGNCQLLRMTVQGREASGERNGKNVLTIDQPIPKIALGAFRPGAEIVIRRDPKEPWVAVVDLTVMGYRA